MSSRKSQLRKNIRAANRLRERQEKKQQTLIEKNRKPGETDEMMEARMKRDLFGFQAMIEERELEKVLLSAVKETRETEDGRGEDLGTDQDGTDDGVSDSGNPGNSTEGSVSEREEPTQGA